MNILDFVAINLECQACGEHYEVPLRDVQLSHKMLHEGCCVPHDTECPPPFQSRYFKQESLEALARAWDILADQARSAGGAIVLKPQCRNSAMK